MAETGMGCTGTCLTVEVASDGIGVLTLNRPDAGNALSVDLIAELGAAIRRMRFDDTVRAVVITGAGRMFCAGVDLKERNRPVTWLSDARAALDAVEALPIPVIAAINGTCVGGGLELALAADIRVAAQSARLGLPEIVFGALPAFGGAGRLTRLPGTAATDAEYTAVDTMATEDERAQAARAAMERSPTYSKLLG